MIEKKQARALTRKEVINMLSMIPIDDPDFASVVVTNLMDVIADQPEANLNTTVQAMLDVAESMTCPFVLKNKCVKARVKKATQYLKKYKIYDSFRNDVMIELLDEEDEEEQP